MRTTKGQHRERLLLIDLYRDSGLNRDDGEAPRAPCAAEERKTDTLWGTNAAAPSGESNPTQRKKGKKNPVIQLCITSVPDTGNEFDYACKTCCGFTPQPAPAGGVGIQNKTSELQGHRLGGRKAVFTKLPAGSGCLIQTNGNWVH